MKYRVRQTCCAILCVAVATLAGPTSAGAQDGQFTAPGSLVEERRSPRERIEDGLEKAQWSLGRMRVDRGAWVRDLGYISNVFNDSDTGDRRVSDVRAKVGAGLVTFLHLGPDVVLTTFVRPEYNLWLEQDQLRELNTSLGAGLFGLFNRATFVLEARRDEQEGFLNDEFRVPVNILTDSVKGEFELDFRGPLNLFGALRESQVRLPATSIAAGGTNLTALDRDESNASLGIEFEAGEHLSIGVGFEDTETQFRLQPEERSFTSSGPLLRLRLQGNRAQLEALAIARDIIFSPTSTLTDRQRTVGSVQARFDVSTTVSVSSYAARDLVFSALDDRAAFIDETLGLALHWLPRERVRLVGFIETGENAFLSAASPRKDDVQSLGARLELRWTDGVRMILGAERTDINSDLDEFDRAFSSIITEIAFTSEVLSW